MNEFHDCEAICVWVKDKFCIPGIRDKYTKEDELTFIINYNQDFATASTLCVCVCESAWL